jgi:hypothetical protein
MALRYPKSGKYFHVDVKHPRALGQCDESGFLVPHADLAKQTEYRGTAAVWTGLMVYRKFLNKLNPQDLAPRIVGDPKIIQNPRPMPGATPLN